MAAPVNSVSTATAKGIREDLENVIYRVAVEDTPFTKNIGSVKATAIQHEWQVEDLAAPNADNAALEGDDAGDASEGNYTVRLSNTQQIFRKVGAVTATADAVNMAGRDKELTRQKLLKGLEVKRDIEARMLSNKGNKRDEAGGTPRTTAGAAAWMTSNVSRHADSDAPVGFVNGVVTPYDTTGVTLRPFTEGLLKDVMASCFVSGGKPTQVYMGPKQKQAASEFTGIAQNRHEVGSGMATIIGAADVYQSDFGVLSFIPVAYGLDNAALVIDPTKWAVSTLRPITDFELAKNGDSTKFEIVGEKGLVSRNEKSSGLIADLL